MCRDLLLAVDGLASYVKAFQKAFRSPHRTGKTGRPRLIAWQGIQIVQVVKQRTTRPFQVIRRIVQGNEQTIQDLLQRSRGGRVINTAYIERLNATFRQRISSLTRRSRQAASQQQALRASFTALCDTEHLADYNAHLQTFDELLRVRTQWANGRLDGTQFSMAFEQAFAQVR